MNELDFKILGNASNVNSFPSLLFESQLLKTRKNIYDFLLMRKSEEDYMDLTDMMKTVPQKVFDKIFQELREMGWKVALSFGDTGLFIFIDNKPKTCW